MIKLRKIFILLFLLTGIFFWSQFSIAAEPNCENPAPGDDLNYCIDKIQREIDALKPAQEANKKELSALNSKISSLTKQINGVANQLGLVEKDIVAREADLAYAQKLFETKTSNYYRFLRLYDPLSPFLFSDNAADAFRELSLFQEAANGDRQSIIAFAQELIDLHNDKEALEKNKTDLAAAKAVIDKKAAFLAGEVEKVASYLADLSSKQQELLAQKFASLPVPLLAYTSLRGCSSDIGKSTSFSPRYGFFSYGVPNKTGLNQYGAKGRAEAGQSYEQILNAYYANFQIVEYGTGFNITVNGTNEYGETFNNETMNIEDYLKHLYEMPITWDSKALQAQAIAARSYALARTNNGQTSIPPNQTGQVVKKQINDGNGGSWINAVNSTSGRVMVQNGSPISAWYSSTHGGVVLKSGQIGWSDSAWTKQAIDTPSGSAGGYSDLRSNGYDKQSPWFFCDWGYRSEYGSTAWLKEEEVVDIVNAFILWENDNSMIIHLSQTDKPTSETWSADKVRQEIQAKGDTPISSISSISTNWSGSGISGTITVNGRPFDAQKFKNMFNLRAPANIQIKPTCQPDSSLNCSKMYALYEVVKE